MQFRLRRAYLIFKIPEKNNGIVLADINASQPRTAATWRKQFEAMNGVK